MVKIVPAAARRPLNITPLPGIIDIAAKAASIFSPFKKFIPALNPVMALPIKLIKPNLPPFCPGGLAPSGGVGVLKLVAAAPAPTTLFQEFFIALTNISKGFKNNPLTTNPLTLAAKLMVKPTTLPIPSLIRERTPLAATTIPRVFKIFPAISCSFLVFPVEIASIRSTI